MEPPGIGGFLLPLPTSSNRPARDTELQRGDRSIDLSGENQNTALCRVVDSTPASSLFLPPPAMPQAPPTPHEAEKARRGPELSIHKRASILAGVKYGATRAEIAKIENTPLSTVDYTIDHDSERVLSASKPRAGRPKSLSEGDRRLLHRTIQKTPQITARALKKELNLNVSLRTITRELKRLQS